jgi:PadR family transcriptional regulator PadR
MPNQAELLPGTLDLLILKAVSLGPQHGYGILLRIGQISGNALSIEQGALYPRALPVGAAGPAGYRVGHFGE